MEEGPVEKMGLEKVILYFPLNSSKERGALEVLLKSLVFSLWDRRAKCTVFGLYSRNVEGHVYSWQAALGTKWEGVCTGTDLYTDFVGVKDECLPWTRCALQRRWNKSQLEAFVSPGQESCWEDNETPAKRIYRLHLLGAKDVEDSWRKVYHQCHSGAFKHSP